MLFGFGVLQSGFGDVPELLSVLDEVEDEDELSEDVGVVDDPEPDSLLPVVIWAGLDGSVLSSSPGF